MNKDIPRHIAIIMDGNGRWARAKGLPKIAGHRQGAQVAHDIAEACRDLGVKILTLYTFSTENWKRPKEEISGLFALLSEYIDRESHKFNENRIRFNAIGDIEKFPPSLRDRLTKTMTSTRLNEDFVLNLALNYGSRAEILHAVQKIADDVRQGRLTVDGITEERFSGYLYTGGLPDPDLLIRTSGEMRLSNFLLWQISYAELYVTEKLWPDFKRKDLEEAIADFQKRDRRFGG